MIQTIDVDAKEWFNKINGNSYFSAIVTVDFGTRQVRYFGLPFQYGYGNHYISMAKVELIRQGLITPKKSEPLWSYCRDNNIILRTNKQERCLKRELTR